MNINAKLLTIAALLLMWSCTEKETSPTGPDDSNPIEFGNVSTRALITNISQVTEFGVSCAISNADNTAYGSIMDNVRVYRTDNADTPWDYDNKRYWLDDSHFYFVASYPYVKGGGFVKEDIEIEDKKIISYNLNIDTYDEDLKDQIGDDILTASEYVNTSDPWESTVNLKFHHLLTNVNFEITQDMDSDPNNHYYITKISLSGVSTNCVYRMMTAEDQLISYWTIEDPANDASYDKSFNNHLLENNPLTVWGNDGLMLIPQNIERGKVKIRIDYLYQLGVAEGDQSQGNPEAVKQERSETIDIPATDLWKSGNKIKYTLSFAKPSKIIFSNISVKPWGSAQPGATIIIK